MAEFKDAIQSMKKIIFLCHGNICRSPMAEYVMKDLLQKAGLSDRYFITSGAVSTEELGNPSYPPAQQNFVRRTFLSRTIRRTRSLSRNSMIKIWSL